MLSCRDATQRISEGLDHRLSFSARMGLRFHVLMCGACRRYRSQILGIEALLRRNRPEAAADTDIGAEPDPLSLSRAKREEIKRALGGQGGGPGPVPGKTL